MKRIYLLVIIQILTVYSGLCQDSLETVSQGYERSKTFHMGLYVGALFANKYTASLYDGYGYDINGQRNTFATSIMNYEINYVYGGGNGGVDQIAALLNVSPGDWIFNEGCMPLNLRYTPAYVVGLNTRYIIDDKSCILLNVNGSKLSVNGKFNIYSKTYTGPATVPGSNSNTQIQNQFTIVGGEQRLMFQLGYQRHYGKNQKVNFFTDLGLDVVMAKAQKHQAFMSTANGSIIIDLMQSYSQPNFSYLNAKYFVGVGIGTFGSIGVNFNVNPKYTAQLFYNPSYDLIPLGDTRVFKMQHGVGLRFYYNLTSGGN